MLCQCRPEGGGGAARPVALREAASFSSISDVLHEPSGEIGANGGGLRREGSTGGVGNCGELMRAGVSKDGHP